MDMNMGLQDTKMEASLKAVKERKMYRLIVLMILAATTIVAFLISISIGALTVPIKDVLKAIFKDTTGINRQVIWNVRLPRTLIAALVGICLSTSGAILQGVMRNPLASPSVIGVSSGAGLAAVIILILFPQHYYLVTPFAFLGALMTTMLIYGISWKEGINPSKMILAGVAVSTFLSAGINGLMIFFPDRVHGVVTFMVGGLSARTWKHLYILWPYTLVGLGFALICAPKLNILMLGDETANNLGLRVEVTKFVFIVISSLLAASAVSVVGLLGFVGLIAPHMARIIIGSDYRYLFPVCALFGSTLLMFCDTVARVIMDPVEIPVGIIMAVLGSPFFLYLLRGGLKRNGRD